MRLAASRNSDLRSSVGGGPAGAGIGAQRRRRLAVALLGRGGGGTVAAAPGARRGGPGSAPRAPAPARHHADLRAGSRPRRQQLGAQRGVLDLELREPVAQGSGAAVDKVDQPAEDRRRRPAARCGRTGSSPTARRRARAPPCPPRTRARRRGPRCKSSPPSEPRCRAGRRVVELRPSVRGQRSAASHAGASAPNSSKTQGKMCSPVNSSGCSS